jgi:UDP-N-acetylmuramyl pentapeptide phosphotransferase/UDP-N-acetylglucosamine-1-phosphate transferase
VVILNVLITSFLIGFLVLPVLIKFLKKIRFGDIPGGRKIHKEFTPSMGGIGILLSFFVSTKIYHKQKSHNLLKCGI